MQSCMEFDAPCNVDTQVQQLGQLLRDVNRRDFPGYVCCQIMHTTNF